jgi:OmpA-OmpF porin, OOP family
MTTFKPLRIAAAVLLMSASAAFAQAYVGAGIGPSHINVDCAGTVTCDRSDTGFKLFGGWRFSGGLAGELTYFDWGKARATVNLPEVGLATGELTGKGIGLGLAYFAPFTTQWQGVVRVGIASNKATGTGTLGDGSSGSISETSTQPYLGLGIGYLLRKNLSIDAALDISRLELLGGRANTRLLTVGLTYSF